MNRETIKRSLIIGIILIVIIIIIGYSYYASHGIVSGPSIILSSPSENQTSFSTSTVNIQGTALRVQSISLDGRPIVIDETGHFSEIVLLSPGYNVETLVGTDKFGQTTTITRQFVYLQP